MDNFTVLILIIFGATLLTLLSKDLMTSYFGYKNLFPGSGDPYSMAKALYGITSVNKKILFAIFLITIIVVAIKGDVISVDVGAPIITGVIGYIFGVRDTNFEKLQEIGEKKKSKTITDR
jgi:hypothetical protein